MSFLYEYQHEAVQQMRNGCILNGGVGSGKSRTGLYYYFKECGGYITNKKTKNMTKPKPLYIITTAMKRDKKEWEKELIPFGLSYQSEMIFYPDLKIVVDSWNNIKKYKDITDSFFIFDEDRVTGKGAWVKTFLNITKHNQWIILSATPGDTWEQYIPVFIANGFYKNRTEFEREHCIFSPFIRNYKKIDRYVATKKLEKYRNLILINMEDQRTTEKHNMDIYCDYDRETYRKVMRDRWDIYKDEPIAQASSLCYVLRRIANSDKSRLVHLDDIIMTAPTYPDSQRKFIIFYNFDYELELLKNFFEENYPYTVVREWNGHQHDTIPIASEWFYLVQYNAGCEGWNCKECNRMVFFSQNYSYKMMIQAAGRIDRIDTQYKHLYYYFLRSKAPIDLSIRRAFISKKDFNEKKFINIEKRN